MIATKKANGEAAHLSCCVIDGEYVMCGGSKNVHMMFRTKGPAAVLVKHLFDSFYDSHNHNTCSSIFKLMSAVTHKLCSYHCNTYLIYKIIQLLVLFR